MRGRIRLMQIWQKQKTKKKKDAQRAEAIYRAVTAQREQIERKYFSCFK